MSTPSTPDDLVLTLIADPAARVLTPAHATVAVEALEALGARTEPPDWLSVHVACDVAFSGAEPAAAENAVRDALGDAPLDVAVQPRGGRRKRALVADMDSTIVTGETLDEMADALGLKERIAAITARAMNGELDFAEALRERVAMLEGLSADAVQSTLDRLALTAGAETLVRTMKAHGGTTVLVTGGFSVIAEPVAGRCGFDRVVANRLLIEGGHLTGKVGEPIVDKNAKLATLRAAVNDLDVDMTAACAVGDGANDLPMLQAAGLGVAFRAKPSVRAAAPVRIDHGDLTALLYLQGYRDGDLAG